MKAMPTSIGTNSAGWLRRLTAGLVRRWRRLQGGAWKAGIAILERPDALERLETSHWQVRIRNWGTQPWLAGGPCPVTLSYHWLTRAGDVVVWDGLRTPLPRDLAPGDEATVAMRVQAPDTLGTYNVAIDLVQEQRAWFAEVGSSPATATCAIAAPRAEDIDYHQFYRKTDLNRDHWSVVGPRSEQEFLELSRIKRQLLIDLGLTPKSRVLDVGCGTGLLAAGLIDYLDDDGLYCGTDIGKEGVEFCQAKYRRPNFVFVPNEMTSIPLQGVDFDLIVFFSVFTHTYPEETALLLQEARRLLRPGGRVLADLFLSPMVETCAGNRGAIELHPETFFRLVDRCGMTATEVEKLTLPWGRFAQRMFFTLTVA